MDNTLPNRRRLFVASCVALTATAMAFSLRTDIMGALAKEFDMKWGVLGLAVAPGIWGFTISIILWSTIIDVIGFGTSLWIAFGGHMVGTTLIIFATGFWTLWFGWLLIGLANGMVEASINPLAATVYKDKKTHMLNILHAWWPGGLIIGGVLGLALTKIMGLGAEGVADETISLSWKLKMCFIYLAALIYGALIWGQKFPESERVQAGVSTGDMFKQALRGGFLFLLFCMLLTASTELGFNQWVGVLMQKILHMPGIIILIYTSALMFVLRHFAGPLIDRLSPPGLLVILAVLSGIGLLSVSYASTTGTMFIAATILGIGVSYFWPTMLGITSERYPKGGALLLGLMGGAGMAITGWVTVPLMGHIQDVYTAKKLPQEVQEQVLANGRVEGKKVDELPEEQQQTVAEAEKMAAKRTVRWLVVCPAALLILFGAFFIRTKQRGGYKQEILAGEGEGPAEAEEGPPAEGEEPEEGREEDEGQQA